jgi:hypothetical protein
MQPIQLYIQNNSLGQRSCATTPPTPSHVLAADVSTQQDDQRQDNSGVASKLAVALTQMNSLTAVESSSSSAMPSRQPCLAARQVLQQYMHVPD